MNNDLGDTIDDLTYSLKHLNQNITESTKLFTMFAIITAELNNSQFKQQKMFNKFNEFILFINENLNYDFRTFYINESRYSALDHFNYIINFINEKYNKKILYIDSKTSFDQSFLILDLMKEVVEENIKL
jgi:hypothetical protein